MSTIADLQNSLNSVGLAFNRSLAKARPTSYHADNALLFNNSTATSLIAGAVSTIQTHINRRDNPHSVTAAQVGTLTKTEIDAYIKTTLLSGILPLSRVTRMDTNPASAIPAQWNITSEGYLVSIGAGTPVLLNGRSYVMPALAPTLVAKGTISYFYVVNTSNGIQYLSSLELLTESDSSIWIGYMQINASNVITAVEFLRPSRIDNYRPSEVNRGSSFPVTEGIPGSETHLAWT